MARKSWQLVTWHSPREKNACAHQTEGIAHAQQTEGNTCVQEDHLCSAPVLTREKGMNACAHQTEPVLGSLSLFYSVQDISPWWMPVTFRVGLPTSTTLI